MTTNPNENIIQNLKFLKEAGADVKAAQEYLSFKGLAERADFFISQVGFDK